MAQWGAFGKSNSLNASYSEEGDCHVRQFLKEFVFLEYAVNDLKLEIEGQVSPNPLIARKSHPTIKSDNPTIKSDTENLQNIQLKVVNQIVIMEGK